MYDPEIARWHSIDPLAEKFYGWSPYNYCYNNPLRFVDFDGLQPRDKVNKFGISISMSLGLQAGLSFKTPVANISGAISGPATEGKVVFGVSKDPDDGAKGYVDYTTTDTYFSINAEVGANGLGELIGKNLSIGIEYSITKDSQAHPVFKEETFKASSGIFEEISKTDHEGNVKVEQKETIRIGIDVKLFLGFSIEIFWERVSK